MLLGERCTMGSGVQTARHLRGGEEGRKETGEERKGIEEMEEGK